MMRRVMMGWLTVAVVVMAGWLAPGAGAQERSLVPADVAWVMQFNASTLADSAFGRALKKEMEQARPDAARRQQALTDTLGFDLFKDTGEMVMYGSGFKRSDTHIAIDLGPTAGNIEGLLLAAPGYQSKSYRQDVVIHSVRSDDAARMDADAARLYVAVVRHPATERWTALGSHREAAVRGMVDQVVDGRATLAAKPLPDGTFMQMQVLRRPPQLQADRGPHSHVLMMIERMEMTATADKAMTMSMEAKVVDAAKARQVAQLVQGGLAMLQLAATNRPDAERLAPLLRQITVSHTEGQDTVRVKMMIGADDLILLRQDQIDL